MNMYSIKKGEKAPIKIKLHNRDEDQPIDLTGSQIHFQLKDELSDKFYIVEKIITESTNEQEIGRIIDAKNGLTILRFTDEDYEKLVEERIYYATLWWEKPNDNFSKVISGDCSNPLAIKICYP